MKRPNFKVGQFLRTTFAGPKRDQIMRLVQPVSGHGGPRGGQWFIQYLAHGTETTVLVDNCPHVGPAEVKALGLS